jgi:low affinity Fe/Cu permease
MPRSSWFSTSAKSVSRFTGGALCFGLAMGSVLVWAITGPLFDFSANWQMVINTGTTIVTFLMVFLIQSSQNRDTEAIQIKLDELIRSTHGAQNALMGLEELEPKVLAKFRRSYTDLASRAKDAADIEVSTTGTPDVSLEWLPPNVLAETDAIAKRAAAKRDGADDRPST